MEPDYKIHDLKESVNNIYTESWEPYLYSSLHEAQTEVLSNAWWVTFNSNPLLKAGMYMILTPAHTWYSKAFSGPMQLYYFQLQLMNNIKRTMKCIEIENVITMRVYPGTVWSIFKPSDLEMWVQGNAQCWSAM